jgi:hypothetical protein
MNTKLKIFVVGGLGCIAPNIINYASHVMSGGSIPANIAGLALGGTLFFIIAGFLVAYILNAKDIRDAFYKGVAVPALVISLANGVTAEKNNVHEVPAVPVNTGEINLPGQTESSFLTLWSPAPAYAQTGGAGAVVNGTVEFEITPQGVKNISVSILDHDGNVIARTRSDNSAFKISFPAGEYTAAIETDEYYKEEQIRIAGNQATKVAVVLEQKGFIKKFSGGVKSLLKR